jgi:hypothetical protein
MINNDSNMYGNDYDDPRIEAKTVYSCTQCMQPKGYDSLEGIKEHLNKCLYDVNNHSCVMCKDLKIIQTAPYPRLRSEWYDEDVFWAFKNYTKGYCLSKERLLTEEDILNYNDCFIDGSDSDAVLEYTDEYKEFLEISNRIDLENLENNKIIEKEMNDRIKKELEEKENLEK